MGKKHESLYAREIMVFHNDLMHDPGLINKLFKWSVVMMYCRKSTFMTWKPQFVAVLMLCWAVSLWTASYYVSPTGLDANNGTSTTSAWQTIDKINGINFPAGSAIYFEGGKTFSGNLTMTSADGGDTTNRVIISSYGTGRATISAANRGNAIDFNGCTGIHVKSINLVGAGRTGPVVGSGGKANGKGIWLRGNSVGIVVDSAEITGFRWAGICLDGTEKARITNVNVHHNGYAGITARGGSAQNNYLYLGYSRFNDNIGDSSYQDMDGGGQGIELLRTDNSLVEYCEGARNGGCPERTYDGTGGGPVGIWSCESDNIIFQYCIAHNNTTASGSYDGGGFDFDDATTNSILQYCYSYDNWSSGFLVYSYQTGPVKNCQVRYFISENDGYGRGEGSIRFGGEYMENIKIYNSTFYNTNVVNIKDAVNAVYLYNNIFTVSGSVDFSNGGTGGNRAGNIYWNYTNNGIKGPTAEVTTDPKLTSPGNGAQLTDPTQFHLLTAYQLQSNSPCINAGVNLNTAYGINPGTKDFYGNTVPSGSGYDVGAHEVNATPVAPQITSTAITTATVGTPYSYTVVATGNPAPTFSASGLPSWLSFNSTSRILSGTPLSGNAGTTGTITITASNSAGNNAQTFQIVVTTPPVSAPAITSTPTTTINVNVTYSYTITTTGYPIPTLAVSGLPSWLSFNASTATISGTPTATGTTGTITVTASNSQGNVDQTFTISTVFVLTYDTVGSKNTFNATNNYGGMFRALSITPTTNLTATTMAVHTTANPAGNVQMAIYSNNAGSPGTMLASTSSVPNVINWTTATLSSSVNLVSGTTYWLVFESDNNTPWFSEVNGGSNKNGTVTYGTFPTDPTLVSGTTTPALIAYGPSGASTAITRPAPLGVKKINIMHDKTAQIYSITGRRLVTTSLGKMPKGVYIAKSAQQNKVKKILIK